MIKYTDYSHYVLLWLDARGKVHDHDGYVVMIASPRLTLREGPQELPALLPKHTNCIQYAFNYVLCGAILLAIIPPLDLFLNPLDYRAVQRVLPDSIARHHEHLVRQNVPVPLLRTDGPDMNLWLGCNVGSVELVRWERKLRGRGCG